MGVRSYLRNQEMDAHTPLVAAIRRRLDKIQWIHFVDRPRLQHEESRQVHLQYRSARLPPREVWVEPK